MGVDAVMPNEGELYNERSRNNKEYVSSINPNGDSDPEDDQDIVQNIQQKRQEKYVINHNPSFSSSTNVSPTSLHQINQYRQSTLNRESLMVTDEENVNHDPLSQQHKQIQNKNNQYQNRQFDRGYTPARSDAFSHLIKPSTINIQSQQPSKREISDSRKEIVNDQPRSYRDIMQMREIQKQKKEAIDILSGKRKKFSDQQSDDDQDNNIKYKKSSTTLGKRKYNSTVCIITFYLSLHFYFFYPCTQSIVYWLYFSIHSHYKLSVVFLFVFVLRDENAGNYQLQLTMK